MKGIKGSRMIRSTYIPCLVFFLALSCPVYGQSKQEPISTEKSSNGMLNLSGVEMDTDENASLITIKLDQKPSWDKVELEEHGGFLQLSLDSVLVSKPGEFVDGKGPIFSKIGLFQPNSNMAALRLFTTQQASDIIKNTTVDVLDSRIIVRTDHEGLNLLAPTTAANSTSIPQNSETMTEALRRVKNSVTDPDKAIDPKEAATAKVEKPELDNFEGLGIKLTIAAVVAGFVLILAMTLRFGKNILKRLKVRGGQSPSISTSAIEMLSTQILSPKQKLAVIKVGPQKFLINISNDAVSMLSELTTQTAVNPALAMPQMLPRQQIPQQLAPQNIPMIERSSASTESPMVKRKTKALPQASAQESSVSVKAGAVSQANSGRRINIAIGDEGVVNRTSKSSAAFKEDEMGADDVTKLIREKLSRLRNLQST